MAGYGLLAKTAVNHNYRIYSGYLVEKFNDIYHRATERKGSELGLEAMLGEPRSAADLIALPDAYYLSEFTKKVFQSGFVWRVVEQKWPDFEELFWQFDIEKLLMMPPDMLEQKAQDKRIIRNFKKVKTIIENAQMMHHAAIEYGSFSTMVAEWPTDNIIGLWDYLKKKGSRLGGNTGPYGLRFIGKDTFILSRDVESYFRQHKLIEGGLSSKRSLQTIQGSFNQWMDESGRSLQQISRVIAFSCGDNYIASEATESAE